LVESFYLKRGKERELRQAKFNTQDAKDSLLENPKIPASVKEKISVVKEKLEKI